MNALNKAALPKKVNLSGADCFHLVLEKHAKKHGAGGNVMRKVFYFPIALSSKRINSILKNSAIIYWLCNIKLARGPLFKIPYWKFIDQGNEIILLEHYSETENELPQKILERDITVDNKRLIEADLVFYPSGSCAFILSWNHIVLDAKGTSLLFEHLNHTAENPSQDFDYFFPATEKKTNIIRHIRNMYEVKNFIQRSSRAPVSSVAKKHQKATNGKTENKIIQFNVAETRKIQENAFKTGSRFGPTLYFVACCSHVIHLINKQRKFDADIWLPVPYDGRLRGASGPLISNCVSFLFYRIPQTELDSIPETVKCLNNQMTAQIRDRIPQKYNMFLDMMRHAPLWLYYFLISQTGEKTIASYLYTSTGDNFNELKSLFGESLSGLAMIPALTFPPGLTYVFLKHEDKLSLNITYSPDIISNNDLHLIELKIKEILLANY